MTGQKMMNAWLHKPDSSDPVHELLPIPEPKAGEVLLKIKASGLCHSELHMFEHHTGIKAIDEGIYAFGHELSGVVVKNGPEANAKIGQLSVVIGCNPCLNCKWCNMGREQMCKSERLMIGLGSNGGNAEYITVRQAILIPVPDGVSAAAAATATDAILTPYHSLKTVAALQKNQICVVIGLGGLGLNAVSISLMLGAKTYGVDIKQDSIAAARKLGAEAMTMAELQKKFEDEGILADVVCDAVGSTKTFEKGQELLGVGGAIVAMGLANRHLPFNTIIGIDREIRALSAFWGTKKELIEILDHIAAGRLTPMFKSVPMSQVPHYVNEMRAGRTAARTCFIPESHEQPPAYEH